MYEKIPIRTRKKAALFCAGNGHNQMNSVILLQVLRMPYNLSGSYQNIKLP